ncbi:hypothetical protein MHU86_19220 [Fragilaria crotonensis]|nr:hypothetical protein MHU86_19220 [Fragilaria crotonensis]
MEAIIQSKQFTAAQLRRLNHCRIFLNAITLSDLTTVVGDHLDMEKIKGQTSLFSLGSRWMKIHQESPSALEWRLWQKANKLWSTSAGKLIQPLGSWLQTHSHRRITAIAYQYDTFLAICKGGNEYITCEHIGRRRYTEQATDTISYENLPEHARPVDVIMEDASCWRIEATTKAPTSTRPFNYGTFDEYVSTLEPWETDLLQHHELFIDPYSACLELQPRFFAGSDGSEKYGTHGAFGWTISTIQGERVASGMGPSRGSRMDSYRAECSGVLSILRFLIQIATFTAMHEPWQGVIGTDSKSLLDKLSPNPTSYDTNQEAGKRVHLDELTPEWDLLIEIQEGLRLLPGVSLTHVKGHQDDSQPYDRLSLLAQLNVDADKMATSFQTKHGLARPIALMTPNTGIHLVHSTGTITGKYEDRIRLISTSPALVSKIQTKYHWSDSTMRMVHWKAHGKAIKVHHTRRVHLSKLIHDCLPTHELLNKFDSGKRTCSLCQHHCEDRDHIIRCPHSSRETWRLSFLQSLNTFHSTMHTSPILRHVLNKAFAQWLDPQQPDEINPVLFHTNVGKLIRQQNLIGWRQLFNGRFSVEWARMQEDYYQNHRNHTKFRRTGIQWQQRLIVTIWTQWEVVWKQRNGDVHGHNMTEKQAAERAAVASQLREIYDTRQHMEPSIQRMLHTDVRTHLQTPNWVTRNWISMHGQLFKDSIRRVKEKSIQGVRSIRSYFHPVP